MDFLRGASLKAVEPFSITADPIAQRLGEPGVVEDPDAVRLEVRCHPSAMPKTRKTAVYDDAIPAGEDSHDIVLVALEQRNHGPRLPAGSQSGTPAPERRK